MKAKFNSKFNFSNQRGATLIVSLIILLLITILGVSTIRTATLEERMASNARNKDIALQAAETAINAAEAVIAAQTNINGYTSACASGLCSAPTSSTHRWEDATLCSNQGIWACYSSAELSNTMFTETDTAFSKAPRYFIELLSSYEPAGNNKNLYNYGSEIQNTEVTVFRITAIGYGGTEDTRVVLQSTYAKTF